jgi:hypothetical protein
MKRPNKLTILLLLFTLITNISHSQNLLTKALNALNEVQKAFTILINAGKSMDTNINKDKVKEMANDFLLDVGDIINAKKFLVASLSTKRSNPDLRTPVEALKKSMQNLKSTLSKYNDLIKSAGVEAIELRAHLQEDWMQKLQKLDDAKHLLDGNPDNNAARNKLIEFLNQGIKILESSQKDLQSFSV